MKVPPESYYALVIESDPFVRGVLREVLEGKVHVRFEERLDVEIAGRCWSAAIPPVGVALVELPDTTPSTLRMLVRLRAGNPRLPLVLTVRYDGGYQLAEESLAGLSDGVVFRPFEAAALANTLCGLARERGATGWPES